MFVRKYEYNNPIPVEVRSEAWVCDRSLAEIAVSNPAGRMVFFFCDCVLSARGPCDGPITRPDESYQD